MSTDVAALPSRLESLLGSSRVTTTNLSRWAIDEMAPRVVVRPADAQQVGAVLRVCGELGAAVIPRGGGTAIEVGNVPRAADVILLTDRLSDIVDYDHSNLTVTVQGGVPLEALGETLAGQRQFLPLDPPHAEAATVGGTAAVALNGPRRLLYGSVRDLVIGVRVARADGVNIRWGGKTVKNVAGYDMCKLFVGSLGTLGLLTELTLKVFPLPEASRTLVCRNSDLGSIMTLSARILASPLLPAAMTAVDAAAASALGPVLADPPSPGLLVSLVGFDAAVARHEGDITRWANEAGMDVHTLGGDAEASAWRAVRDFGWDGEYAAVRLSTPHAATPALHEQLRAVLPSSSGIVVHVGSGTVWIRLTRHELTPDLLASLRPLTERHEGHLLTARAPRAVKTVADVWFPPPPALPLMQGLKHAFDPRDVLNPGRFVSGL